MVRLSDLHPVEAEHMRHQAAGMRPVTPAPWIEPKPLTECTVAIVSTAGLHRRSDTPFKPGAVDYRLLPGDVDFADVVVSHVSTNFDRSGFQRDPNIWFPLTGCARWQEPERLPAYLIGTIPLWRATQSSGAHRCR